MTRYQIQNYSKSLVLVFATDDDLIEDAAHYFNGLVRGIVLVAPALTGATTCGIRITDAAGNIVYSKAALAASTTHQIYLYDTNNVLMFPLSGTYKIGITTSGAQDANRTFAVAVLIEK
jgi:hypothetical protein